MNVQTLMRMTSDAPECITRHLNVFFAQGGDGYVRSGGSGNRDMELTAWIREAAGNIRAEIYAEDNECLCDELYDNLMYGIEEPEGVVAYLYLAALQAIEMRGRLKKIEDILGDTYDLDRLRELVQADREGDILRRNTPMSIYPDDDSSVEACPTCGSGEYLYNEDGNRNRYCGQCGQRIDWTNDFYDRFFARLGEGNGNE